MATAPTVPLAPADDYLRSSYEHDLEFVDGVLVQSGTPTIAHSLLQKLLLFWFARFEESLRFEALQEVRTQLIQGARYRIPDVMLCPTPVPKGKICDVVPWVVIEILSPDDALSMTRDRLRDYTNLGVQQLVLMDPEEYIAYRFEGGSLIKTAFETLSLPSGTSVPFDSSRLFEQLRGKRGEE
jgi:Uma2 family endonuclease